ncbi:2463_t:CDS:2 [Funneliformis geosporum]|uniref:2463_t:CDS:1 n=1 Tax=Funneliformis geosporum TaxID=1117311 RepID=A0A9W4SQ38_9GLOM|nr:2463_t:CDS:2 [Funneliformis geosporum]
MSQVLPTECLNEIFENLEDDDLLSCLLVNRQWCEVSVPIFWRKVQSFDTLLNCLPNKSKIILNENGSINSTSISISRQPLFNYVTFIKSLWINEIDYLITRFLNQPINSQSFVKSQNIAIKQEIFKMLMNQTSLKKLSYYTSLDYTYTPFIVYPGGENCLSKLSIFHCSSNVCHEFINQLSQICHNLKLLKINFRDSITNGLADFISVQKHLKYLNLRLSLYNLQTFIKLPNSLIKLRIEGRDSCFPFLLIYKLSNLQELSLSAHSSLTSFISPEFEYLIKFLENNGWLRIAFPDENMESNMKSLKVILNSFQQLERMNISCGPHLLEVRKLLEIVSEFSPKMFYELKIDFGFSLQGLELGTTFQWELRSSLKCWANRIPCILLSFIVTMHLETDIEMQKK